MWKSLKPKTYGIVIYNFTKTSDAMLNLEIGDTVSILHELNGWLYGYSLKKKDEMGIFPASYVILKSDNVLLNDPVVQEVSSVLKEWLPIWKNLFIQRNTILFDVFRVIILELLEWCRELISSTLTQDQIHDLKLKISTKIDWGNRKLGLDLVPRIASEAVDLQHICCIELYQMHLESSETSQNASARGTIKKRSSTKTLNFHLYFALKSFYKCCIDDLELYFSIYAADVAKFIRFVVPMPQEGSLGNQDPIAATIFTDLGIQDLSYDLHLVCQIIRRGKMTLSDSVKKSPYQIYRRPYACGIIRISSMIGEQIEGEKEYTMKLYQCDEKEYHVLHEILLRKLSNKYNPLINHTTYDLEVSLRLIHGDIETLIQNNPSLLKNIIRSHKLGFADVIMPGDVRSDLYITLDRGEFEKGGKSIGKNIEVVMLVLDKEGQIIESELGCIWKAAGTDSSNTFTSYVLYHNNSPKWVETIRLTLPIDKFSESHLRLEYFHCPGRDKSEKKMIGFSFTPLMDSEGAVLKDGSHDLVVYKCEDKLLLQNPSSYLKMAWCHSNLNDLRISKNTSHIFVTNLFHSSSKEYVVIQSRLFSTKLTQNGDLLALLKWRHHQGDILFILERFRKLDGQEVVKFLQDILDALFAMFMQEDGNPSCYTQEVFHVVVSTFNMLESSKLEHFKPVLKKYIHEHFSAILVAKPLMHSIQLAVENIISGKNVEEHCHATLKVLEPLMKCIVQSQLLFIQANGDIDTENFLQSVHDLFHCFVSLMSLPMNAGINILECQKLLINVLAPACQILSEVLPLNCCANLLYDILLALPLHSPSKLLECKLNAFLQIIKGPFFMSTNTRQLLLPLITQQIRIFLYSKKDMTTCLQIIEELIKCYYHYKLEDKANFEYQRIELKILHADFIEILVTSAINPKNTVQLKSRIITCLIGFLGLLDAWHYEHLWEGYDDLNVFKEFLTQLFSVFREVVKGTIYSDDWFAMKMVNNRLLLDILQFFGQLLLQNFMNASIFNEQLWTDYLTLCVAFTTQDSLQLEKFSEIKCANILDKYGDIRLCMTRHLLYIWSFLESHRMQFVPAIIRSLLDLSLLPVFEIRQTVIPVFFDLIDAELKFRGNFRQVESEIIDKLDILIGENKGDDEYKMLFNKILMDKVCKAESCWHNAIYSFISSVTRLMEYLLDYRRVSAMQQGLIQQMNCTVKLLNFYRDEINRKEMYVRYIYKLHDFHINCNSYIEAAFTLQLHANLLGWSHLTLHADLLYPGQQEWQRKERLYLRILDYLDKGKCWEEGFSLCKELANLYECVLFDYDKLSSILRKQAQFCENILTEIRPEPEYFRVEFLGKGFPTFLRDKTFIFRGLEYERIDDFQMRLSSEFSGAQFMRMSSAADNDTRSSNKQFLQVCSVKPLCSQEMGEVPKCVKSYYLVNRIHCFQYSRPFHKGPVDPENEFKTLWLERTTLTIKSSFPGILRWSEVSSQSVEQVSPIQVACEQLEDKCQELRQLIREYTADPGKNINVLSMKLQGIIDANVNGGIFKYQEAFLREEALKDKTPEVSCLLSLISDQLEIVEQGLQIHEKLIPDKMRPLHQRLHDVHLNQKKNFVHALLGNDYIESRKNSRIVNTPLPPLPLPCRREGNNDASDEDECDWLYAQLSEQEYKCPYVTCHDGRSQSLDSELMRRFNPMCNITRPLSDQCGLVHSYNYSVDKLENRAETSILFHMNVLDYDSQEENPPALPKKYYKKDKNNSELKITIENSPPPIPPRKSPLPVVTFHKENYTIPRFLHDKCS